MTRDDIEAWVERYVAAWASRQPRVMSTLWHADGRLRHPALDHTIDGTTVPVNNDNTKALIPDLEWRLRHWAASEDVVFLEWVCTGTVGGVFREWEGVDRMILRDGRIAEEVVFFDTYPLRRALDSSLPDAPLVRAADLTSMTQLDSDE
jgi:SnoaL-like domain